MTTCDKCNGEGMVCDECGQGDHPVRTTEYGDLCLECLESILEKETVND